MFFLASKLLEWLLQPVCWFFALSWLGIFLIRRPAGKRILWANLILFYILSNDFLSNTVMAAWELPALPIRSLHHPYPVAVVLGGFTQVGQRPRDRVYLNRAADRLMHTLQLYQLGKVERIIISGGNSWVLGDDETEAENAHRVAILCMVPPRNLIAEDRARNTHENATYSKDYLRVLGISDTVLLVTSASHARRALGCFRKEGIPCRIYPTDFRAHPRRFSLEELLIPSLAALDRWQVLLHEWFGMVTYKAQGYL